jgi:cyclopropane-fatty-acyl-phospholipid synthase
MATLEQISRTYDYMDEIMRLTYGENFDISCALYDGDFSKSLERAQRDKHQYILRHLGFKTGSRFLDVGCGWGPILHAAREAGGHCVGLTLSPKQMKSCKGNGFEVYLLDWKDITPDTFGPFDGIVSVGAFEHFCSPEEYFSGQQEPIYGNFFRLCHDLLPEGGRLYLQTMMWGKNAPRSEEISVSAPKGSNGYLVGVLSKFYPGSWLPYGEAQILKCAEPYFSIISMKNGREDYIQTMKQWRSVWKLSVPKAAAALKLIPNAFRDPEFHFKLRSVWYGYQRQCFSRMLIDHQRIVFEKRAAT